MADAPAPAAWKAGFLDDKTKKRPGDAKGKVPDKKAKVKPAELPGKYVPKLVIPGDGPFGDIEVEPSLHVPQPKLGPMLMPIPSLLPQVVQHKRCSLDDPKHWTLHVEPGLGVEIDLIRGDTPAGDPTNVLPPEDEAILKALEPLLKQATISDAGDVLAKGKKKAKDAVWLKNTTYLSNNLHAPVHAFGSRSKEQREQQRAVDQAAVSKLQGVGGESDIQKSFSDAATLNKDTLRHPTKPHLRAEYVLPVAPDSALWANSYVQVSIADDPDAPFRNKIGTDGKPLPLPTEALVSKVVTTSHKKRGANVLSASYSRPKDDSYDWSRQYQLNFKEERAQDGARLVLLIDEAEKTATFVAPQPKRMELDKGRSTDAAREDADTPIDTEWSGVTEVTYEATDGHKARGFDASSRNAWRARMRAVDADDISADEDVSESEESSDGEEG